MAIQAGQLRQRIEQMPTAMATKLDPMQPHVAHLKERSPAMYLSRLTFHTLPGKTGEVEQELQKLMAMVAQVGGIRPRVLRNHFASLGAPDVVFEQEAQDLEVLERQIRQVTENPAFQQWTGHMSGLLAESPKREVYRIMG